MKTAAFHETHSCRTRTHWTHCGKSWNAGFKRPDIRRGAGADSCPDITALAVPAAQTHLRTPLSQRSTEAALDFLEAARHPDGGWGGGAAAPAGIEETAVATTALLSWGRAEAAAPGLDWLHTAWTAHALSSTETSPVDAANLRDGNDPFPVDAAPIGLYFQSLWYSESLYPLLFSAQALRATIQISNKRLQ